ncbi:MAG: hypothetical protein MUD04_08460 [Cyanobium sp. Prado107]|jgi:hypothetical protein|nr:hypothetical protein [Cyanobium sp. Prado107]
MASPLRSLGCLAGSGLFLLSAASAFPSAAVAEVLVQAQGRCKLMSGGFEAYNGHCTFKHKQAGNTDAYVVKFDDGTDFVFSGPSPQALSVQTYRGIVNARHSEESGHDVFVWDDGEKRRLSVKLDTVQNPNARFEDSSNTASVAAIAGGAAAAAVIGALIAGQNSAAVTEPARVGAPVSSLQSLLGVKGASAERELTAKGYTYRGGEQMGDSAFTYWEQPRTNNCVAVRTTDGRYQSITYAEPQKCR